MQGEEVLLMIDLNEHFYTGNCAKALAEQDILMDKIFYQVNNIQGPTGHFIHHREFGLSDHRMHCLDITMEPLFECSAPAP